MNKSIFWTNEMRQNEGETHFWGIVLACIVPKREKKKNMKTWSNFSCIHKFSVRCLRFHNSTSVQNEIFSLENISTNRASNQKDMVNCTNAKTVMQLHVKRKQYFSMLDALQIANSCFVTTQQMKCDERKYGEKQKMTSVEWNKRGVKTCWCCYRSTDE